ncbi:hypothetical protein DFJ63DRAFT_336620 [Scheffersomyces coipomensis]|uniref:uncharacterized protein n=1 Tax=Scheffersomyces coipomensis TaxID=1788519 RepID=UPI00315D01FF
MNKSNLAQLPLPDLRFEQTFMKQLNGYAGKDVKSDHSKPLTDSELQLLNTDINNPESSQVQKPIGVITPSIVIYAIFKDQILMPLLQGFLYTGFLISIRPLLNIIVRQGQQTGIWLSNLVGLNTIKRVNRR